MTSLCLSTQFAKIWQTLKWIPSGDFTNPVYLQTILVRFTRNVHAEFASPSKGNQLSIYMYCQERIRTVVNDESMTLSNQSQTSLIGARGSFFFLSDRVSFLLNLRQDIRITNLSRLNNYRRKGFPQTSLKSTSASTMFCFKEPAANSAPNKRAFISNFSDKMKY